MEKMISYIFGNIELHDKAIGSIAKTLRAQANFNKSVKTLTVVSTAWMVLAAVRIKDQQQKIEELTKEVEELKATKGE